MPMRTAMESDLDGLYSSGNQARAPVDFRVVPLNDQGTHNGQREYIIERKDQGTNNGNEAGVPEGRARPAVETPRQAGPYAGVVGAAPAAQAVARNGDRERAEGHEPGVLAGGRACGWAASEARRPCHQASRSQAWPAIHYGTAGLTGKTARCLRPATRGARAVQREKIGESR
ncbi:hypothetical protein EXIGLDRAFT_254355 [Exidia glandulosa HHB12029]|uniref:Uncharacterized protein n=1 Tax=Exidia glandulosa HHB12029 TaxID=1314781 RepID=A0A165DWZ5_EXIGL|nr:hypothetical protein EXIGLDRAFT_254355 [Exidia glandulosa HHB12029]